MASIPGLSFCPADENLGVLEITTLEGKFTVPGSHLHGHCYIMNDFDKINSGGSFGETHKHRKKGTSEYYTLKISHTPPESGISSSVLREISLLSTLKHDNIVNFYGVVAEEIFNNYLILDYCPLSLKDLIENEVDAIYASDVVKCIMKQLFQGLVYIHDAFVIHRNITDENIVFTHTGILKLTGFNASRYYSKEDMTPNVSDLTYRAPELLFQSKRYSSAIDMWSAGCLFAKLLLRKSLFYGRSELEVLRSIFDVLGIPSEAIWPGFTELFSKMAESQKIVEDGKPYSAIKEIFGNQPLLCQDLIKDLLIYYPKARFSSNLCMKSTYITELPNACSLKKLSSILKNLLPAENCIKQEKMDIDFSLS